MISHTARSQDPSLAQAVGFVVLESAAAEDTMGELVVIRKGSLVKWWKSGAELCEAVESLGGDGPAQLAARLRQLLPLRNTVVHSVWLDVMSREVVEPAGRRGSDRGVDPVMIVEVHPPRQRGPAFGL